MKDFFSKMSLLDLPLEIVNIVAGYLPLGDVLSFCSTCRWLRDARSIFLEYRDIWVEGEEKEKENAIKSLTDLGLKRIRASLRYASASP